MFCDHKELLHPPFIYKYLQAGLWQPRNAQQEVKSQVPSKRHSLCWHKVDNHARYGGNIVAEGHTMSALAGSALGCSQERGMDLGAMLPGEDLFISKSQTTGSVP